MTRGQNPASGGPAPLLVANGTAANPVYVAIKINGSSGTAMTPLGIVIRRSGTQSSTDPQSTAAFPSASISGTTLTLCDQEDGPASYDFDILFTDAGGNYGLLDPRLTNN